MVHFLSFSSGEMDLELGGRALSGMGGSGRPWLQGRVGGASAV